MGRRMCDRANHSRTAGNMVMGFHFNHNVAEAIGGVIQHAKSVFDKSDKETLPFGAIMDNFNSIPGDYKIPLQSKTVIAQATGGAVQHAKPVIRIGQIAELPQKPDMTKKLVCFRIQTGGCYNYVFQEQPAFTPFLNDRILEAQFFLSQKIGGERINCPISLDPIIWIQANSNDDRKLSDL